MFLFWSTVLQIVGWWEMKSLKLHQVPRDFLIHCCFLSHLFPATEGEPFQKHISSASYVLYLKSAWEECQAGHQTGSRMLLFLFSPHDYVLTDTIISEIKCWKILWTWYTRQTRMSSSKTAHVESAVLCACDSLTKRNPRDNQLLTKPNVKYLTGIIN